MRRGGLGFRTVMGVLLAVVPASAESPAPGAPTRTSQPFSEKALIEGTAADAVECARRAAAIWVRSGSGTECLMTYASHPPPGAGEAAPPTIVVFLHGDHLAGRQPLGDYDKVTPDGLLTSVRDQAAKIGVPVVLLARPGVYGSSGDHKQRRRLKEFDSLSAAVEALRQRYGVPRIVLAGQSGGATAVAALLTLRQQHLSCAIMASGGFSVKALAAIKLQKIGAKVRPGCDGTGYCDPYDPIDQVAAVPRDATRRLIVIGDPDDRNTVFALQMDWVQRLRKAGHAVEVIEAQGRGPDRHSLSWKAFEVARECATWSSGSK